MAKPEYIDREAFLDYMKGTNRYFSVKFDIENFPAADVAPVVHGRWVPFHSQAAGDIWHCSACKIGFAAQMKYCPNCGARMDLEETGG